MPTANFVALQCCQCFTMQVKQRKKSSNKWTCVVCNQKQSVLKVFAQGPMAKDVRKFVQSFNMTRKFTDQNQLFDPTSEYDIDLEDDDGGDLENPKKRHTDWTEYLDSEDHHEHKLVLQEEEQGVDLEPEIVTELPAKEKFKRPKLRNSDTGEEGVGHQLYKPLLYKRNCRKATMLFSQDEKADRQQQADGDIGSKKQSDLTIRKVGEILESMRNSKPATSKVNSKWKDYITEEDEGDSLEQCCPRNSANYMDKWGNADDAVLNTDSIKYQIVEDDIHPDFM